MLRTTLVCLCFGLLTPAVSAKTGPLNLSQLRGRLNKANEARPVVAERIDRTLRVRDPEANLLMLSAGAALGAGIKIGVGAGVLDRGKDGLRQLRIGINIAGLWRSVGVKGGLEGIEILGNRESQKQPGRITNGVYETAESGGVYALAGMTLESYGGMEHGRIRGQRSDGVLSKADFGLGLGRFSGKSAGLFLSFGLPFNFESRDLRRLRKWQRKCDTFETALLAAETQPQNEKLLSRAQRAYSALDSVSSKLELNFASGLED